MGIVPFYISWLLTSLLMINRDYGRPAVVLFCHGFGIGEGVTMIFFSMEEVKLVINTLLDITMDRLPDNPTDPLFIMKRILAAQEILEKEAEALEKELDRTPYPE